MTKKVIVEDSFLVSGIMCHQGCGQLIQNALFNLKSKQLPPDAHIQMDAEPQSLGVHRLSLIIESKEQDWPIDQERLHQEFAQQLEDYGFDVSKPETMDDPDKPDWTQWINLGVNLISMTAIIILGLVFPPSILLTVGLTLLSFATSAFSSRAYLLNFFNNIRHQDWANLTNSVALGWFLSLAHSLYHSITMPLAASFSMLFMSFVMPILLIAIINGMDEIKRRVMNKSKKMHLHGINTLFPQMSDQYFAYDLSQDPEALKQLHAELKTSEDLNIGDLAEKNISDLSEPYKKNTLKADMLIRIGPGECFPVDCILVQGRTLIDSSLLTGEPQQEKEPKQPIPAGAINLGPSVIVLATANSYNSTINQLLFRSNRKRESTRTTATPTYFNYLYGGFIVLGIVLSIVIPLSLGLLTFSLAFQNITGILFAVCPCTIGIAQQLPEVLSRYYLNTQGIKLINEEIQNKKIHTLVCDKTGTLTTGNSVVESRHYLSDSLWQRIYLLEKNYGAAHPLAKAICAAYEKTHDDAPLIKDITEVVHDVKHRGLSARVQGKHIQLGSAAYLQDGGIQIPTEHSAFMNEKLAQGCSIVHIAEDNQYAGFIIIQHELRPGVVETLSRFKKQGIRLIMLTGDNQRSAQGFNQRLHSIFEPHELHAEQTPSLKEQFLTDLMRTQQDPTGVWFVGDGLNDAPCSRIISEKGGVSCAMNAQDKVSFFTDLSLNGSLDYLDHQERLTQFLDKNVLQNKWILGYGALAFLAFTLAFSITGIAVSPLIPMLIMVSTTLFTLFNSSRVQHAIQNELEPRTSMVNQFLHSDASLALPISASAFLLTAILIASLSTGGLIFPAIVFSAGILAAVASASLIISAVLAVAFISVGAAFWAHDQYFNTEETAHKEVQAGFQEYKPSPSEMSDLENQYSSLWVKPATENTDYNIGIPFSQRNQLC